MERYQTSAILGSVPLSIAFGILCSFNLSPSITDRNDRSPENGGAVSTQNQRSNDKIKVTLLDIDGPIIDADIILQTFKDEKCAKTFMSTDYANRDQKYFEKRKQQLEKCAKELSAVKPDKEGRFVFTNIRPGWYALRFLWNIKQKPDKDLDAFWRNGFMIGYSVDKDLQGKYDAMAQGMASYFSGKEDLIITFDFSKP